jgi:hypothetical protein
MYYAYLTLSAIPPNYLPTSQFHSGYMRLMFLHTFINTKIKFLPGMVDHACNLMYSGRLQFKASQDKKLVRPHLNQKKLGVVLHSCHPSYTGSINRRIAI